MVNKTVFACALAVVLVSAAAGSAAADGACAKTKSGCGPVVHGTARPGHRLSYLPNYMLPENQQPLLYNTPHEFNPLDFPSDDYPRAYYPGLGDYR